MRSDAQRNASRILAAARELIAQQGPDVSMDAIAAAAGVAVGTLYRHHPTKADLVAAALDESIEQLASLTHAAVADLDGGADPGTVLPGLFRAFVESKAQDRALKAASVRLGLPVPGHDPQSFEEGSPEHRVAMSIQLILDDAVAGGRVRADLTLADLMMLLLAAPDGEDQAPERARYTEIILAGLRP